MNLYQLPPGEFIAARNALARQLREQGKEEEAKRVAALRKPSEALWLVNQMSHKAPAAVRALIEATEKMRDIQHQGRSGDELRDAMRQQREALQKLLGIAPISQSVQRRVQNTLQAAARSEPEALREGRLEHELEPAGFEAVLAGGLAKPDKHAAEEKKKIEQELRAAEKKAHELEAAAERAESAAAKADAAAAKAREHAKAARAEADAAGAAALELRRKL
jgi:hypothetical protein